MQVDEVAEGRSPMRTIPRLVEGTEMPDHLCKDLTGQSMMPTIRVGPQIHLHHLRLPQGLSKHHTLSTRSHGEHRPRLFAADHRARRSILQEIDYLLEIFEIKNGVLANRHRKELDALSSTVSSVLLDRYSEPVGFENP